MGISMSIFPFMGIYKYESSLIREYYGSTDGKGTAWNASYRNHFDIFDDIQIQKGVMLLEHVSYHNEAHVLSLLDIIRISGFRPVSDLIDTREQCGD